MSGGGAPSARLRTLASQSAIYGIGPVVARFAGLLLLPIYTRHLGKDEVANVGQIVALVAVGATIAQLGLVNALFRFAAEREGDARFAVARTAIAICCAAGVALAAVAALADARRRAALPRRRQRGPVARRLCGPADLAALRAVRRPLPRRAAAAAVPRGHARQRRGHGRDQRRLDPPLRRRRARARGGLVHRHAGRARGRAVGSARRAVRPDRPRAGAPAAALRPAVHALARRALGAQPLQPPARRLARDARARGRVRRRRQPRVRRSRCS